MCSFYCCYCYCCCCCSCCCWFCCCCRFLLFLLLSSSLLFLLVVAVVVFSFLVVHIVLFTLFYFCVWSFIPLFFSVVFLLGWTQGVCVSVCLSVYVPVCLSVYLSVCLSVCVISTTQTNELILMKFLQMIWQIFASEIFLWLWNFEIDAVKASTLYLFILPLSRSQLLFDFLSI